MPDFGNLSVALCGAALRVRQFLDERGYASVSFKIVALHDGKVVNIVGVAGDDDPATEAAGRQGESDGDNGC